MKKYICICGQELDNAQKFNNHKSHCKVHLEQNGNYEAYLIKRDKFITAGQLANHEKAQKRAEAELAVWISEQHVCERCGKVMTEKFGSGRFCSRACANARERSDETKAKISKALTKPTELKAPRKRKASAAKPKSIKKDPAVCLVCGKVLSAKGSSQYCYDCYVAKCREEKLRVWLETGSTGLKVDTTIRGLFRDYVYEQQNHCCAICGMKDEWNGKPINFVLDHIDGDAANSCRENLRLICPNCDSQLDTYKSKNKNSARTKRKEFLKDLRDC